MDTLMVFSNMLLAICVLVGVVMYGLKNFGSKQ